MGSGAPVRVTTFSDGSFYAIGLRPGEYEATLSEETLDLLKARQPTVRFRIEPGTQGETVDVVIRLERQVVSGER